MNDEKNKGSFIGSIGRSRPHDGRFDRTGRRCRRLGVGLMLLMDSHVWFWTLTEPENLSKPALKLIQRTKPDNRTVASISLWEFAMMVARGRIELQTTAE